MTKVFTLLLLMAALYACAQTPKVKNEPKLSGNPLFEGWYADPEVAVFNQRYWIFPTFSAKYEDQVFLDAFSSDDLVNWTKHEKLIDTTIVTWVNKAMWAPSIIEKEGKYYLFFAGNDIQNETGPMYNAALGEKNKQGGIGVCVADQPEGPYTDLLGKPLISEFHHGAQPIDQYVFKALDGNYYIVYGGWGHCNIARISDDFKSIIPFEDGEPVKEITPKGYVEGPTFFIRNGRYYFMWSEGGWGNASYKVAYAIADSPFGPFERLATVLEQDPDIATGAGHHSVLQIPGTDEWYIVYHRRPIPNLDRDHRVVCIDRMYFDEDGTIKPVKMTFEGVEARKLID
ncbi:glycoside hydrolase family 43 protein [Gaoshiqia sp. Z1-71]|uniref:glycoside hydrolase family 43 protein n=1 Tax=Gaoshiqia hydrogeniformans TaxID=3290090 RepID=UPI003BF7A8F1